jgi:hypothetical protein
MSLALIVVDLEVLANGGPPGHDAIISDITHLLKTSHLLNVSELNGTCLGCTRFVGRAFVERRPI